MKILIEKLEGQFELENGSSLSAPEIAYSTFGTLNKDRSNVTLVCHALTANSQVPDWWKGLYGPGNVFDPSKDFIICLNNLGSPYGTVSPKTKTPDGMRYGLNFPEYTIRDTARLQLSFLQKLGISQIHKIVGGSCGGNIAQELAYSLKDKVEHLILLCCSSVETPWVIAIHESQRVVLESDPDFYKNEDGIAATGLKAARGFALPFYRSHTMFKMRQSEDDVEKIRDFKASSYIRYQGEKFVNRYDAHCYYKQLLSLDTHNIGRGRQGIENALSNISAKTLSIGFNSDLLIPAEEQELLANLIPNGTYIEIETPCGHDAFLIETEKIRGAIAEWMN